MNNLKKKIACFAFASAITGLSIPSSVLATQSAQTEVKSTNETELLADRRRKHKNRDDKWDKGFNRRGRIRHRIDRFDDRWDRWKGRRIRNRIRRKIRREVWKNRIRRHRRNHWDRWDYRWEKHNRRHWKGRRFHRELKYTTHYPYFNGSYHCVSNDQYEWDGKLWCVHGDTGYYLTKSEYGYRKDNKTGKKVLRVLGTVFNILGEDY